MRMVKWLLIGAGVLVALAAVMVLVGLTLPKTHSVSRSIRLASPPDSVWALVRTFGAYADWWPDVERMERLPDRDGHEVWNQVTGMGAVPLALVEIDAPRRLVARIAADDLGFGGTWTYVVAADGDGASLTITEDGEISNPFFRVMTRFFLGYSATIESYQRAAAARLGAASAP